jgi:methionyl-tRNA formyltransferase
MKSPASVLFLGKRDDDYCRFALAFCRENFNSVTACLGSWGEPIPKEAESWSGDFIISYLSRWVVPISLLDRARIAINFHPGSPEFPGIGCVNFALYGGAREYGATCHHMWPRVDTGPIIEVAKFSILESDDVEALLNRTYSAQFDLFLKIAWMIKLGSPLPQHCERWTKEPYTRTEFNELNQIAPWMPDAEKARRIRACAYRGYFPTQLPRTPQAEHVISRGAVQLH